jgi:signal transduction histidine kinase
MADVTRAKEMEHLMQIQEKMATLGHVAAGIAHEIRNPLSGINIHLSALERIHEEASFPGAEGKEQAARIMAQIQSASRRIESVIRKVMDFSRPAPVRAGLADLNQSIEDAVDFTSTLLRRSGITLDRSRLESLPQCYADSSLLTQVIMNLITNAVQAMEGSEGQKLLEVSSALRGGRIVIRVSDSGPGIPASLRGRIFDPFYTTRKDGYGIGLSFSRKVVEEHGGTLTADTSTWGGAEFRIEIPFREQESQA